MRVVIQRVSSASVRIDDVIAGEIGRGLLVLLGIQRDDTEIEAVWLADKVAAMRVFEDDGGKMNLSIRELETAKVGDPARKSSPAVLVVSQFTLIASTRKGNRPSFNDAANPVIAVPLYEKFVARLESQLGNPVATGRFGARMEVALVNDGPVTLVLDSRLKE